MRGRESVLGCKCNRERLRKRVDTILNHVCVRVCICVRVRVCACVCVFTPVHTKVIQN